MTLNDFNKLTEEQAKLQLGTCCGSSKWSALLMKHFPFASEKKLTEIATETWYDHCDARDWKEAFSHHPKIGDLKSLEEKFASTQTHAGEEQSGVVGSSKDTIEALVIGNEEYEKKNGFIFIVCATGKSATEM
ncbi:MAG TPA: 2-oxo-4-hydroxy-4-carboxy-5-ureidoimidazoline decarboxylase, partial [Puia sp.]|nr:2-oxo-4-hydroxy-4-carboxy-5-ureidoimidazoline decarboxylase [Puia sp.]